MSQNFKPWELRDALRNNCVSLLGRTYFNKSEKPLLPYKHSLIAYHLIADNVKVKKAQDLKRLMEEEAHLFRGRPPGQQKRAKFPTSKAHISAVFHSFRLIFGRAIISRNGLEA